MDCANCTWSKANHTNVVASSLTCGRFTSREAVAARNASTLTVIPERCPTCNEALTPRVTKGAYKCKCDQPRAPRSVLEAANNTPLSGQVRYGGR
jgi:hypothetical protein